MFSPKAHCFAIEFGTLVIDARSAHQYQDQVYLSVQDQDQVYLSVQDQVYLSVQDQVLPYSRTRVYLIPGPGFTLFQDQVLPLSRTRTRFYLFLGPGPGLAF